MSNIKEVKKHVLQKLKEQKDEIEIKIQRIEKDQEGFDNTINYYENKEDITKENLEDWKNIEWLKQQQQIEYEGLLQEREECFQKIQSAEWFLKHLYND